MELKEFVKETLVQITKGVQEAQDECYEIGGLINPMLDTPISNGPKFELKGKHYPASVVKFTVGLTESNAASEKGGIGVFLPKISLGVEAEKGKENQTATNVEFSIVVIFPYVDRQGKHVPLGDFFS
ncbi:MAG: hypothetical protein LBJ01_09895 [Tannerella sp.]|jgi:hypothetical protein|nr:hypothetical protein [Tannerella sp.]